MLYFSYGSNMSERRLKDRVPSAKKICKAFLRKHDLRFHKKGMDGSGKCDACFEGNHGNLVIGVLYEIDEAGKNLLDRREGLGNGYDEKFVEVITPNDDILKAVMYSATKIDRGLKPFIWYREHVLRGALENNFPGEYIDKIRSVEAIPDPDLERERREMNIYREEGRINDWGYCR